MRTPNADQANEGRISERREDAAFHADILGDDQWPPDVVAAVRRQAKALGVDPALIPPGPPAEEA